MTLDLLIENARIVDGTGAPWFRGSVGVRDGEVATITRTVEHGLSARETLDAEGAVVCPGFVDTHSHSDLELFADPTLEPKIRQGITTEVIGQDGFSMAPMHREGGAEEWQRQLGALAGRVEREWTWGSTADYFEAVRENGVAPNVAMLVGHGTVRFNVLGMDEREPTSAELEEMGDLVTQSLEEGALGFSTGLIYTPCTYASTEEVRALAARLAPYQRPFVAHVRSEGRWIWEALDEFVDIGAEEDVPLHLSHFKLAGAEQHGKVERATGLVETARERGVDFTAEQYPYTAGSTMLSATLPPWIHADGPDRMLEMLATPEIRQRAEEEITNWTIPGWENIGALAGWDNVVITSVQTDGNRDQEGKSIAEVATERDETPVEAVCTLLVEEELRVSIRIHMLAEEDVTAILANERVCIGTDGLFGGKPHPRVYGSYPRILGHYVRDRNLLTVEEAVRKMTSLPARAMGLDRKGVLRPGMDADLVVFDPTTVESRSTWDHPNRFPEGISHVVVGGQFVVADSESTGELPGEIIRA